MTIGIPQESSRCERVEIDSWTPRPPPSAARACQSAGYL